MVLSTVTARMKSKPKLFLLLAGTWCILRHPITSTTLCGTLFTTSRTRMTRRSQHDLSRGSPRRTLLPFVRPCRSEKNPFYPFCKGRERQHETAQSMTGFLLSSRYHLFTHPDTVGCISRTTSEAVSDKCRSLLVIRSFMRSSRRRTSFAYPCAFTSMVGNFNARGDGSTGLPPR
jgi:hypothetical protein